MSAVTATAGTGQVPGTAVKVCDVVVAEMVVPVVLGTPPMPGLRGHVRLVSVAVRVDEDLESTRKRTE